jgi:hypothetical protein
MNDKTIKISLWKALAIVFTAILGSAGASIWGTLAIANTIPFRVNAVEAEIKTIQQEMKDEKSIYMPLQLSEERWKTNESDHDKIEKKLDTIESIVNSIRNSIR